MSPIDLIRLESSTLRLGQTAHCMRCVWCDGGLHKEHNFYITRGHDGVIRYICHRASCGKKGRILDNKEISTGVEFKHTFVPNAFVGATKPLSKEKRQELRTRYHLTEEDLEFGRFTTTPNESQLVMPVFSPVRNVRGHVTREVLPDGKKQIYSWKLANEPWQSWYRWGSAYPVLLIVEDQLSALRASRTFDTVALIGTFLSSDKLDEIIRHYAHPYVLSNRSYRILVCLDKDATAKGISYIKSYGHLVNLSCTFLSKDIKDMSEEEFLKFSEEILEEPI